MNRPADNPGHVADADVSAAPAASAVGPGHQVRVIWRRLGPAGPLAVIAASMPGVGGFVLLGMLTRIAPWLKSQAALGPVLYVLGFSGAAGLALLPTYAQSVLGGWAFGFVRGTAAAVLGVLGASAIGYVIARRASRDRVLALIHEHPKWKAVYDSLLGGGRGRSLLIVTLLRLPPNSPFAITNLVLAATRVPPLTYFLGTVLGLSPRTALAAFIGATGSGLDFSSRRQTWLFVAGIVVTVIVVSVIGVMANRAVARVTGSLKGAGSPGTAGPPSRQAANPADGTPPA